MKYLIIYLSLFLLSFIICAIIAFLESNELKDVILISLLNIVFLLVFLGYRLLKRLAMFRAEKILGHKPRTVGDFRKLGVGNIDYYQTPKNLLRILFMSKEEPNEHRR